MMASTFWLITIIFLRPPVVEISSYPTMETCMAAQDAWADPVTGPKIKNPPNGLHRWMHCIDVKGAES